MSSSKSDIHGYTEAEKAAALWRQMQGITKKEENSNNSVRNDRRSRDRRDHRSTMKSNNNYRNYRSRSRDRNNRPTQNKQNDDEELIDEFGRVVPKKLKSINQKNDPWERCDKTSEIEDGKVVANTIKSLASKYASFENQRYNNRNYDQERSRSRDRGRGRSRSRSNSRSRQSYKSSSKQSWTHDKYNEEEQNHNEDDEDQNTDRRKYLPKDYIPPEPRWISKAGGVAIIRK